MIRCNVCNKGFKFSDESIYVWIINGKERKVYYGHGDCYWSKENKNKVGKPTHDKMLISAEAEKWLDENFICLSPARYDPVWGGDRQIYYCKENQN